MININESRRLSRILAGKEKPQSRYDQKIAQSQIVMDLKDLKFRVMRDARALIKNADPNDPFARDIYMFAFKGKFHKIESGTHKIISEAEVNTLIEKNSETKLYYICTNSGMCPLPDAYVGKGSKAVQVKDDDAVIDYIKSITGVTIKKSDL
jgi:hypothetical protein